MDITLKLWKTSVANLRFVAVLLALNAGNAAAQAPAWEVTNFFSPCIRNCEITILAGQSVSQTKMSSIFTLAESPAHWKWDDSYIGVAAFSRPLLRYYEYISISAEIGLAKRFGPANGFEAWAALFFRWTYFPWNEYLRTSIGIGVGPSLSNDTRIINGSLVSNRGVHVINYFTPEIAFGLPSVPQWDAVVRFHHRSPLFGALPKSAGDPQFVTMGIRFRF